MPAPFLHTTSGAYDRAAIIPFAAPQSATGTHYVTAASLTPDALLTIWRSLSAQQQSTIGTKILEHYLAELVSDDDGLVSSKADRDAACKQSQDAFGDLTQIVETALPQVLWYYPDGYAYEGDEQSPSCAILPDGRRYPEDLRPLTA